MAVSQQAPRRPASDRAPVSQPRPKPAADDEDPWWEDIVHHGRAAIPVALIASIIGHCVLMLLFGFWYFETPESSETPPMETALQEEPEELDEMVAIEEMTVDVTPTALTADAPSTPTPDAAGGGAPAMDVPPIDVEAMFPKPAGGVGKGKAGTGKGTGVGKGKGAGTGVQFFGARATGKKFVFVVDFSGSMSAGRQLSPGLPRITRLDLAKRQLVQALKQFNKNQEYLVIFYSSVTLPLYQNNKAALIKASPQAKVVTANQVMAQKPNGGTQPDEALKLALALKPDAVFFLTDGSIPRTALDVCRKFNKGSVIHTMALQSRIGEPLLMQIAKENKGRYGFIP